MPVATEDRHAGGPLTPAEAFVLLDPKLSRSAEAFKVTFLSLVAQGVFKITMVERRSLLRTRQIPVASLTRDPPDTFLADAVTRVVRNAGLSSVGVDFTAIAKSAVATFGPGLTRLKTDLILPALVAHGLLTVEEESVLWLFSRTVHRHTVSGLQETRRISALLERARHLPSLTDTDPAAARAIVLAAGPLLLLIPELKRHYGQLGTLYVRPDTDTAVGGDDYFDSHSAATDCMAFDAGALDFDFGAFDASFDASFTDGFGDSGGDSGGHSGH